jgi:hypothetical protein
MPKFSGLTRREQGENKDCESDCIFVFNRLFKANCPQLITRQSPAFLPDIWTVA